MALTLKDYVADELEHKHVSNIFSILGLMTYIFVISVALQGKDRGADGTTGDSALFVFVK